ncbi:MAG: DJ-1/PfpI family protein [Candidatus Pacebacteria bacterium]|nr:DJ-1/PfpI family protein [Candidatus Paceibacterota bacterium]
MFEEKKLSKKNVLFIIGSKSFRDEEYFIPFEILQKEGATITTASSIEGEVVGVEGGEARSTLTLKQINTKNFDIIIFVGGDGASEYFENNDAHKIIQEAVAKHKVLAAICIAPVILAKAGVLKGRKATVWSSLMNKSGAKELKEAGCNVEDKRVVIDGKIVTADGPAVAKEFAEAIIVAFLSKEDEEES